MKYCYEYITQLLWLGEHNVARGVMVVDRWMLYSDDDDVVDDDDDNDEQCSNILCGIHILNIVNKTR